MTTAAATTKTEANTQKTKTSRCKKAATRIMSKIRRIYRRGVSECAGQMSAGYGGEAGNPPHLHYSYQDSLPRNYSVSSTDSSSYDDTDYRHLIRAASANSIITTKKTEPDVVFRRKVAAGVGRSQSTGTPVIGRIDEEEASEFEDDVNLKLEIQPKNKINGVTKRRVNFKDK